MKLRIKGPTLRLRLTQGEIGALASEGLVEERVPFAAGAQLVYRLRRDPAARAISASYRGDVLEVRVPEGTAREWCTTELVTLDARAAVARRGTAYHAGEGLRLSQRAHR